MFRQEEIWFQREDKRIYSLSYIPRGDGPWPTILICHGFGGSHGDNLNCAERYAEAGFAVCSLDFCGGSLTTKSDGKTTDMSPMTELADLLAVFPQLKARPFVKKDALYLWGESQGGFVAAMGAARLREKPKGLILLYPALLYQEVCRDLFPAREAVTESVRWGVPLGPCYYQDVWDVDPFAEIGAYSGPVLIFHGTEDHLVPLSVSRRALGCYAQAELNEIPAAGHGFFKETGEMVDGRIIDWLRRQEKGNDHGVSWHE